MEEFVDETPKRKRHFLVTLWLGYLLVNGISSIIGFTIFKEQIDEALKIEFSPELVRYLVAIGFIDALGALFLLKWKKIGFHFIIIATIINVYVSSQLEAGVMNAFLGLSQIFFTYVILNMRKYGKSTWEWLT